MDWIVFDVPRIKGGEGGQKRNIVLSERQSGRIGVSAAALKNQKVITKKNKNSDNDLETKSSVIGSRSKATAKHSSIPVGDQK